MAQLDPVLDQSGEVEYQRGAVVQFDAGAEESNDLRVSIAPGAAGEIYRVRDNGAALTAGAGCTQAGPREATCTLPADPCTGGCQRDLDLQVQLADRNDNAILDPAAPQDATRYADLDAGPGDDQLVAWNSSTRLAGGGGIDVLRGGEANDTITDGDMGGFADSDVIDGGGGTSQPGAFAPKGDRVSYADRTAPVTVDLSQRTGGEDGEFDRLEDIEEAAGGHASDLLLGDSGDNWLGDSGESTGSDTVNGGEGNDWLTSTDGTDTIEGAAGEDDLSCGDSGCRLFGGPDADGLTGGDFRDRLDGGSGNDSVSGDAGRDSLYGGSGRDRLYGGRDEDRLIGGSGNDGLRGDGGYPFRGWADTLDGGSGSDVVSGEGGNDTLYARDRSRDKVDGGRGFDRGRWDRGRDRALRIERLF